MSTRIKFTELTLCADVRRCERCGELTYWKRPLQRSLGHCPDHTYADGPEYVQAFATLIRVLRPARVEEIEPERYAPGAYGGVLVPLVVRGRWLLGGWPYRFTVFVMPQDAGPCVRCGGRIRAYGPNSHPLCTDCEKDHA